MQCKPHIQYQMRIACPPPQRFVSARVCYACAMLFTRIRTADRTYIYIRGIIIIRPGMFVRQYY